MDFDWMAARDSVLASQQQTADRLTASFERQRLAEGQLEDMAEYVKYLKELAELRRIADAAEAQAKAAKEDSERAKKESEEAKEEAKAARRRADISNMIAFGSFVVAVIALIQNLVG